MPCITGAKKSITITKMREDFRQLLKRSGFRATAARIEVLKFLAGQKKPVGIRSVAKAAPDVNTTTLYRMMTDFVEKGLVKEYELGHGHVDYEIASRPHHHHIVCESCGDIEDVFPCEKTCEFTRSIEAASKKFASVTKRATTFYGICKSCA